MTHPQLSKILEKVGRKHLKTQKLIFSNGECISKHYSLIMLRYSKKTLGFWGDLEYNAPLALT